MKRWLMAQCVLLKAAGIWIIWASDYALLGWTVFLMGGVIFILHLIIPNWQGACDVITRFFPTDKSIWLTIDDGPDPEDTPRILEVLAEYNAKATFFLIGERAERYPELVKAIREQGHSLGCHTYNHPTRFFWIRCYSVVVAEIDRALGVIENRRGDVQHYRSPVGIKNVNLERCLRDRKMSCIGWSIRSGDALGGDVAKIVAKVRQKAFPGAILVMHEGPSVAPAVRVEAIRGVLETLTSDGYAFILPSLEQLGISEKSPTPPPASTENLVCN